MTRDFYLNSLCLLFASFFFQHNLSAQETTQSTGGSSKSLGTDSGKEEQGVTINESPAGLTITPDREQ